MRVVLRVFGVGVWAALGACQAEAPEPRFVKESSSTLSTGQGAPPTERKKPTRLPEDQRALTKPLAPRQGVPHSPPHARPGAPEGAPPARITRRPSTPDPLQGKFSLAEATKGLPKKGKLSATIETGLGTIECSLYADKTPDTVANFVGLARGLRPFWDGKQAAWVKRPLFDGTSFHRAIADFMIQGGDHLGDGTGTVGYDIPDELVGLKHDRAGLLCMANRGPNTNGGQFFITDAAAPHLTQMNTYTIFGECTPLDVIHSIARAPRANSMSEKPDPVIPISRVTISKK